jgi:predicted nuclease with TOPRIM domain
MSEMNETYTCPGCNALCTGAEQFRQHEQICAPALRTRVAELEGLEKRHEQLWNRLETVTRDCERLEAENERLREALEKGAGRMARAAQTLIRSDKAFEVAEALVVWAQALRAALGCATAALAAPSPGEGEG